MLSNLAFVRMCFHLAFDVNFRCHKDDTDLFLESFSSHYSIHCDFIMKLTERENISSLTDKVKLSQLGKLCFKHSLVTVTPSD